MTLLSIILVAAVILALFYALSVCNSLAKKRVDIDEAWSGIDVQLKRRADLVPNLVETVKGYASHEKDVFENVTKARAALLSAQNPKQAEEADNMLTGALKSLFAVAEAYPQLKASENFGSLQGELSDIESKIAYSRQFYNANVRDFNTLVVTVPSNLVAALFGFAKRDFFEAAESEKAAVKIAF